MFASGFPRIQKTLLHFALNEVNNIVTGRDYLIMGASNSCSSKNDSDRVVIPVHSSVISVNTDERDVSWGLPSQSWRHVAISSWNVTRSVMYAKPYLWLVYAGVKLWVWQRGLGVSYLRATLTDKMWRSCQQTFLSLSTDRHLSGVRFM